MSKESCERAERHRVGLMVIDHANPFEIGVATEIFGLHRPEIPGWHYELTTHGEPSVRMAQGFFEIAPQAPLDALADCDTVIVPCHPDPSGTAPARALDAVRSAHGTGARIVSYCSGSLLLAEAGLLDGRDATTHWRYATLLAERHPMVRFRPDVLFIVDDPIYTSAGSAAAIDLSLELVRRDLGEQAVTTVAKRLVFAAHRSGDQRQFADMPAPSVQPAQMLGRVQAYALDRLGGELRVGDLAREAAMSVTGFHRWFKDATGMTPLGWVNEQRVARARLLLESTDDTVEAVAAAVGLGTAANLRLHFRRTMGTTPTGYRSRFAATTR